MWPYTPAVSNYIILVKYDNMFVSNYMSFYDINDTLMVIILLRPLLFTTPSDH